MMAVIEIGENLAQILSELIGVTFLLLTFYFICSCIKEFIQRKRTKDILSSGNDQNKQQL